MEVLLPQLQLPKTINEFWSILAVNQSLLSAEYCYELMRLSTYDKLPKKYSISAIKLAKAGFYYLGTDDNVECYCCKLRICNWDSNTDPYQKHAEFSSQCPFILKQEQNIPLGKPYEYFFPEITESNTQLSNQQPSNNFLHLLSRNQTQKQKTIFDQPHNPPFQIHRPEQSNTVLEESSVPNDNYNIPIPNNEARRNLNVGVKQLEENIPVESLLRNNNNGPIRTPPTTRSTRIRYPRILPEEDSGFEHEQQIGRGQNNPEVSTSIDYESYLSEARRLESLSQWRSNSGVSVRDMAKTGLFYLGPGDRVQCVFCRGILKNWEGGDIPSEEHAKHFNLCPFILDPHSTDNVPMLQADGYEQRNPMSTSPVMMRNYCRELTRPDSDSNLVTTTAIHENYSITSQRINTFSTFPRNNFLSKEDLAKAGFFYTGNSDNVKCFFCDGGLRNWEPGDDPWTEHARWFPKCGYVLMSKGNQFVTEVQRRYSLQEEISPTTTTNTRRFRADNGRVNELLRGAIVKRVLDMGISPDRLRPVIVRRLEEYGNDDFFPNADSVFNAVLEYEAQAHDAPNDEISHDVEALAEEKRKKKKKKKQKKPAGAEAKTTDEQPQDQGKQLEEEVQRMKDERMCKICMDEEVNIVFLKCGHLVCCSSCAPSLKKCPICRQVIKGTVRVFIS